MCRTTAKKIVVAYIDQREKVYAKTDDNLALLSAEIINAEKVISQTKERLEECELICKQIEESKHEIIEQINNGPHDKAPSINELKKEVTNRYQEMEKAGSAQEKLYQLNSLSVKTLNF